MDVSNVVIVSDTHCGCRLALCPPEGLPVDDGGVYAPSDFQRAIWGHWREFWDEFVPSVVHGEDFAVVVNGDAVEGNHHRSTTQISHNPADQEECAYRVLAPIMDRCKGRMYIVRGTEAHVGSSGCDEERLARRLGIAEDSNGKRAKWELWLRLGPSLVHLSHHIGTTGSRAHESTAVLKELTEAYGEAAQWGEEPPDFIVRSHRHRHVKVSIPTRKGGAEALVTPAWQGKMLALDTPLPTPDGWTTMGDVRVGDTLFDEQGKQCGVTAVLPIDEHPESYVVTFSNGESIKACGDHLWLTTAQVDKPGVPGHRTANRPRTKVRTTREIRDTLRTGEANRINHTVPMPAGLDLAAKELPIDPYLLGCWLGDGSSDCAQITCSEEDSMHFASEFSAAGYCISPKPVSPGKCPTYRIKRSNGDGGVVPNNDHENLQSVLRSIGVLGNKHIPAAYLRSSHEQRLSLLQGLMDTDGYAERRVCEFSTVKPTLRDGVCELLASLGLKYTCIEKRVPLARNGKAWRIRFFSSPDVMPVFRMQRKLDRLPMASSRRGAQRSRSVQIVSVDPCESVPMRCIAVDSESHLYRCGKTMLPTHNTPFAYKIPGARQAMPQFGGIVIRHHARDKVTFSREAVWTPRRPEVE